MKKNILITGAFGNLGLMCVEQALAQGHHVRCFDIENAHTQKIAEHYYHRAEVFFGDIRNTELLETLVKGVDAIIHNASLLPPLTETLADLAYDINVNACIQLIRIAEKQSQQPVFIFPSSVTVFGNPEANELPRTSADSIIASDNYTSHKIAIENVLQASTLPFVITRIGVSVDARTLKTDKATFLQLLAVRADNPLEYVHPKDVALAMCNACTALTAQGKVLLLGGGESCQITQRDFLCAAFDALGLTLPIHIHGSNSFYTHWMDTRESQSVLQFQQHNFENYKTEMKHKLRILRIFIWPLRWLINPLLILFLQANKL
jgi:nucleoside-diphosphate-sugar epimerase